jgi:hypothetical protein
MICDNNESRNESRRCVYIVDFNVGDVVEFVITDSAFFHQSNHPMHL